MKKRFHMKNRSVLLLGMIALLLCMTAAADDKGSIQVIGVGSVVIPADTVTITVSAKSSDDNTTKAAVESDNLLNKTVDALKAAGINDNEILPGRSSGFATYIERYCNRVNNTTTCTYKTSNVAISQLTVQIKKDQDRINKTIDAAKSSGATAAVSGYSISDTNAVVNEVKNKAIENAQQNAQDYASAYGFTLGKVIGTTESPNPDIEIGGPNDRYQGFGMHGRFGFFRPWGMGGFFGGEPLQPGMAYIRSVVRVTYEVS